MNIKKILFTNKGIHSHVLETGHLNYLLVRCPMNDTDKIPLLSLTYRTESKETILHKDIPLDFYDQVSIKSTGNDFLYKIDLGSVYLGQMDDLLIKIKHLDSPKLEIYKVSENLQPPYFEILNFSTSEKETYKNILSAYFYQKKQDNYIFKIESTSIKNELTTEDLIMLCRSFKTRLLNTTVYNSITGIPENVTLSYEPDLTKKPKEINPEG